LEDSLKGVELHKEQLEMMGQCATSMVRMSDRLMAEATKAGSSMEHHKASVLNLAVKMWQLQSINQSNIFKANDGNELSIKFNISLMRRLHRLWIKRKSASSTESRSKSNFDNCAMWISRPSCIHAM
jgi:restriction endonuclease